MFQSLPRSRSEQGEQEGADIRLGELGRPGPLNDAQAAGFAF